MKKSGRKVAGSAKSSPSKVTAATRRGKAAVDLLAFPVVGVGASAGGLAAITDFLKHLPPSVGAAIVIIQHLDPKHGSLAPEILSRVSPIPVTEVKNGMPIRPGHVYVIPPNRNMCLQHGVLKLTPRTESRGQHLPIDLFFRSLAEDRKEQAIGVVLSGIASDGTIGLQTIKAEGGFTIAQEPASAQYDGMPRSAILSGAVDIVLTPEGIAREIAKMSTLFSTRTARPELLESDETQRGPDGSLRKIFAAILNRTGVDFSLYKRSTLQRRISRRLFLLKIDNLQSYATYLGNHPEEVHALFADILIHVTGFFRDREAYEALKTRILPHYLENRDPGIPFRVWVPGCSSGEEAYSIAMVFSECLDTAKVRPSLQIFASDISESSLKRARAGVYAESVVKDVSKARLNRFFEKIDTGRYRIAKSIRDMCLFSKHDLTADPPFAKIDLISCRNVLIYFTTELQKRVIPVLHYALNPGGILWLGRSETISGFNRLFALEDRTNKFYSKKRVAMSVPFQFPLTRRLPEALEVRKIASPPATLNALQAEADRIAVQQYAPPSIVINDAGEILLLRGRPAPYVELVQGQASLNLLKLAHPDIVSDLRYLISVVRRENTPAQKNQLSLRKNGTRHLFGIKIVPLRASPSGERYYSVFFEEASGSAKPPAKLKKHGTVEQQDQVLEDRRYQEELIEEYQSTQEELISSNEELQSTNEELQSTNEELETAKEELQSANEEMTTINDELQAKNAEVSQIASDLTNLLASVDLPIVMVGPDNRIRRFTPKAGQTFNLLPGDVGRSISNIRPGFQAPNLEDMVAEVMATLSPKELEAEDNQGVWYRMQVRPYRTVDNRIDGAVIALADITVLKRAADTLRILHDDASNIIETMPTPILVITSDRRVQAANGSFYSLFQISPAETLGKLLPELCDGHWNIPSLLSKLDAVLNNGVPFNDFEVDQTFPNIGQKSMVLHATATRLTAAGTNTALVAIEDLTARKQTDDRLRHTEERYRHLLENANDGILVVNENGTIELANHRIEKMFGYSSGELNNRPYELLIPNARIEAHRKYHAAFMRQPEPRDMGRDVDLYGKRKDGIVFPVEISLSPVRMNSRVLVTAIVRDISERKRLEADRQELLARETAARREAERASIVKDEFLATLSHELRTPLTTILSWAQMLRLGKADPEKTKRAVSVIEKSAKDQGQLIDDLLDVSRIQAGKMLLEPREINPKDCVVAALESVRNQAENKSITLQTEFDASDPTVSADSGRLEQVFRNLLGNAIKFTPPGGKITVRSKLRKDEDRIEIQVEDTGKGIRPDFLPYLFTRFSQEDNSKKRAFGGLGLGLSIVRNLVEMHKGTVTAYSPGEGKGAVFTVTLPCVERGSGQGNGRKTSKPRAAASAGSERPASLAGLRVLVIDDLEDARDAFSEMLQSVRAEVETAVSSASALPALGRFKPDIALCDIAMPEEDGLSFIRKVRKLKASQGGKTPVIAVTAYAAAGDVRQALGAGFDAHIAKPVDVVELSRLIAKLARRRKKRR